MEEFTERRKVTIAERWTVYTFHAGRHPNEGVQTWLTELEDQESEYSVLLIQLLNDMLKIDPEDRPTAGQVTQRLRSLTLKSIFVDVYRSFSIWNDKYTHLDLEIEMARFKLWGRAVGVAGTRALREADFKNSHFWSDDSFHRQYTNVNRMQEEIKYSLEAQDDFHARITMLRGINDDMVHELPHKTQVRINNYLEEKMVNTKDLGLLQDLKQTFDEKSQYRSIGVLAAVKYMHQLCDSPTNGHGRRMQLRSVSWEPSSPSVHFQTGRLTIGERPPVQALVERVIYEEHWVDHIGDEMLDRIGAVAELLRISRSDKELRVLAPIGYFHLPEHRAFGLAFHIPSISETGHDHAVTVVTLRRYVQDHQKERPSLEQRLMLAQRLVAALARIHKVKWLHKAISAFTIVFLTSSQSDSSADIPFPYITGFNHSRPTNGFSNKSSYPLEVTNYRHPEYAKNPHEVRYQAKFDYYSLGLVLLEIGLWKSLSRITKGKETLTQEELLDYIIHEQVPQLDFFVGTSYREVVTRCLKGEIRLGTDDQESSNEGTTNMESIETLSEMLTSFAI